MSESGPGDSLAAPARVSAGAAAEALGGFPHNWSATVLPQRPLILPRRRFVYPRQAEEIERGALELLVTPADGGEPFLATCALGFADPLAPSGVWSCPNPNQLCAAAGGYVYLIDTRDPARFEQVAHRPVLAIHAAMQAGLLLFVGSRSILAYGSNGIAWESPRLSDEGITITAIDTTHVHGTGWQMRTDTETPFALDPKDGRLIHVSGPS